MNNIEEGNNQKTITDKLSWKDEMRAYEKGRARVLWFNPAKTYQVDKNTGITVKPRTAYVGGNEVPTWQDPVADIDLLLANHARIKSAQSNDIFKVLQDPFIGEYQNLARE